MRLKGEDATESMSKTLILDENQNLTEEHFEWLKIQMLIHYKIHRKILVLSGDLIYTERAKG